MKSHRFHVLPQLGATMGAAAGLIVRPWMAGLGLVPELTSNLVLVAALQAGRQRSLSNVLHLLRLYINNAPCIYFMINHSHSLAPPLRFPLSLTATTVLVCLHCVQNTGELSNRIADRTPIRLQA